jgi:hypothetical protein
VQEAVAVEAYEWVDTASLGEVAANFARAQLLVTLFDGDPDKWISFIEHCGTPEERERDLPFALEVKRRLQEDPRHVHRLRRLLRALSQLL